MSRIVHSSSVLEDGCSLGSNVKIGPFCHIGPNVVLGDNVELLGQVSLQGYTKIGEGTRIFPFASIGSEPQDLKFRGEKVTLEVGSRCLIREGVTMNPGTQGGGSKTIVGNDCVFLANSHVAHDCRIGNHVIFSNAAAIAGHCLVDDHVILGGGSAVHQFSRIGHHAFVGGLSGVEGDLIPFGMAIGNRSNLVGLNLVGMKRAGFSRQSIHALRGAYKELFTGALPLRESAQSMLQTATDPLVVDLLEFIVESADRPLCTPASA